jgi:PTH1 family peptidyl-tRNA hydrolase
MPENANNLYLIVGLGNPGAQYAGTRHNVGWQVVEGLAARHGLQFRGQQARALVARGSIAGHPVILAKPQTYMNLSGQAVAGLVRFFKLPLSQVLIVYDELDLPLGTIRLREGGSAAGHNGLTSVIQQLGTPNVARLRVGIGKPPVGGEGVSWVLGRFSADERADLAPALVAAQDAIEAWLTDGIAAAMNRFNSNRQSAINRQPSVASRPGAAQEKGAVPAEPLSPTADLQSAIRTPQSLRGLGAQIAALQARLGRRPSPPAPLPAGEGGAPDSEKADS